MELYGQLNPDDPAIEGGEDRAVFDEIRRADNLHLFVLEDEHMEMLLDGLRKA